MKIIDRRILILLLLAALPWLGGCMKEEYPKHAIATEQSLQTIKDVEAWSWGFVTRMRSLNGCGYHYGAEVQSDMFVPSFDYGNRGGMYHSFSFTSSASEPNGIYLACYSAIKNANFFLDNVEKYTPKDAEEETKVQVARGRALFLRASCYVRLLTYFSRTEAPNTPGVALVTKYDPTQRVDGRASQEEVFTLVFEDLQQAEQLLRDAGIPGKAGADEITADCAVALRARAYLIKLDYANAKEAAEKLINSGTYALEGSKEQLEALWEHDNITKELIMMSYASRPDEVPGGAGSFYGYDAKRKLYDADWFPAQWVVDLYEANDTRKDVYLQKVKTNADGVGANPTVEVMIVGKYRGAPDLRKNPKYPQAINRPKPFRIAEQYLIAAEACFKLGEEAKAQEHLNALRVSRGLTAVAVGGEALWQEIKEERTRELAFEGFRLHDLRRWGDPVIRREPQPASISYTDNTCDPIGNRHEASDPRFVWPLPTGDVIEGRLQQNLGY